MAALASLVLVGMTVEICMSPSIGFLRHISTDEGAYQHVERVQMGGANLGAQGGPPGPLGLTIP